MHQTNKCEQNVHYLVVILLLHCIDPVCHSMNISGKEINARNQSATSNDLKRTTELNKH